MNNQVTAAQYPQVYEDLGIDPGNLGCLMLNVQPIEVSSVIAPEDLYYADPTKHQHIQGVVSETVPHLTLFYGFLRPASELKKHIDVLLKTWRPEDLTIAEVSTFPSNDPGEAYITLVAKIRVTDNLMEGHQRLSLLPHLDTFPGNWQPHVTLAYLKDSADAAQYIAKLNELYVGQIVNVMGLNYGD